jgi:FKBP-type peptidyl-prolyl cis-trans isomerase 2
MNINRAKNGQTVKVHYTVKKEDNSVYATSKDGQPIQFKVGGGGVISGLEKGVVGMKTGDSKILNVPPEEAFGAMRDELITTVKRDALPEDVTPTVGKALRMKRPDGENLRLKVTEVKEDTVTLDANHPLAGQMLTLDVEMVEIVR